MNETNEWNGPALFLRRCEKGLTLHELGTRSGVRYSSISLYERNRRRPTTENARKLAKALRCKLSDLYRKATVS